MSQFYNPYMKSPDFSQGINDFVAKLMQMMMMKQMFGQQGQQPQPKPEVEASGQAQLGQPRQAPMVGAGIGSQPQPQPTMGAGPPGMAQAGMGQNMAQQMPQLMMAIKNNPQLLQMIMQMINPGGMNQGAMMGGGL